MAISKITLNGVTQMDVTQKTVTANTMLNGITSSDSQRNLYSPMYGYERKTRIFMGDGVKGNLNQHVKNQIQLHFPAGNVQ